MEPRGASDIDGQTAGRYGREHMSQWGQRASFNRDRDLADERWQAPHASEERLNYSAARRDNTYTPRLRASLCYCPMTLEATCSHMQRGTRKLRSAKLARSLVLAHAVTSEKRR
jgi:hypothetical protein